MTTPTLAVAVPLQRQPTRPWMKTAYVDAVATLPAYQRQGYGNAVMQDWAKNIADYRIAGLETERPAFYARLGWEVWRGTLDGRSEQEVIPTPEQKGIMVFPICQSASRLSKRCVVSSRK